MATHIIRVNGYHYPVECDNRTIEMIMNGLTATYGTVGVYTKRIKYMDDYDFDVDDWSETHQYALFLIDNADNLDLECPF